MVPSVWTGHIDDAVVEDVLRTRDLDLSAGRRDIVRIRVAQRHPSP